MFEIVLADGEGSGDEDEVILLRGNSRSLSGLSTSFFSADPSISDTTELGMVEDEEDSREESHSSAEWSGESEGEDEDEKVSFSRKDTKEEEGAVKKRRRGLVIVSDSEAEEEKGRKMAKKEEEGEEGEGASFSSPVLKSVRSSVATWKKEEEDKGEEEEEEEAMVVPSMVRASTSVGNGGVVGGRGGGLRPEWGFLASVKVKNEALKTNSSVTGWLKKTTAAAGLSSHPSSSSTSTSYPSSSSLAGLSSQSNQVGSSPLKPSTASSLSESHSSSSTSTGYVSKSKCIRRAIISLDSKEWHLSSDQPNEVPKHHLHSSSSAESSEPSSSSTATPSSLSTATPSSSNATPSPSSSSTSNLYLEIRLGNLTEEAVDVIVNAANSYLQHGGGVAGAISSKGGPGIQRESTEYVKRFGALDVGHCCHTKAYNIRQCKYVIHTVGPIHEKKRQAAQEAELYSAVFRSLLLADSLSCASIALPAISSGIFGFPKDDVARVLIAAAMDFASASRPSIFSSNQKIPSHGEKTLVDESMKEAMEILKALPRPPSTPRSLRLIRLTNFDTPTVDYFEERFDQIFK